MEVQHATTIQGWSFLVLSYVSVVTGSFYINDKNDRLNDFYYNDLNPVTGEFEVTLGLYYVFVALPLWIGASQIPPGNRPD